MNIRLFLIEVLTITALCSLPARAEMKVIEADNAYRMGDNDSKIDARRIAIQEAKRKALELAGAYVESLTVVKNYQLTKDEVKAYTAGILETEVVSEQMRGTTDHPEIYIRTRCTIDTAILSAQIDHYGESEDLKELLKSSVKENEDLKKERDLLVNQLAAEKDKTKADDTRNKLDRVLTKEEANDDTGRVWIEQSSLIREGDDNGQEVRQADLDKAALVLEQSIKANPQNQRTGYLLAIIYQRSRNYPAAENLLRSTIQRRPSSPAPHLRLGLVLKERGRYQEALKEFHFVERLRPHYLPVVFFTGLTLKEAGTCGKAVQYLNRFLKDPRANKCPKKKQVAIAAIEQCGGDRPGRQRRARQL